MAIRDSFLAELRQEAANTRRMLERVPSDKLDWKPHEKSFSLGKTAHHIAHINYWTVITMTTTELDFAGNFEQPKPPAATEDILRLFDEKLAEAIRVLEGCSDEDFHQPWTMRNGEQVFFTLPRIAVLRNMCFNHVYHHRGQLSVYLRLLDVPVPGMYGPSADDRPMM